MDNLELIKSISIKNDKKIIMMVIDGLGGIPWDSTGKTELEMADTPNMDALARVSQCGLTIPVSQGITPGSGPSHLSLFGYDPIKYQIGRGILEALGIGLKVDDKTVASRANFATIDYKTKIITDRRAGRIPTDKNELLCKTLQESIKKINDVEITIKPGKGHRFVVLFCGDDLNEEITENDPQKENKEVKKIVALNKNAEKTAEVVNTFLEKATDIIKTEPSANYILLRGFSKYPIIPSMKEVFKLSPCAIATYPMYKGLAQIVGMEILKTGDKLEDEIKTLKNEYKNFDFFYLHVKETDAYGEDGNYEGKVKKIEEVDKIIPEILSLSPDVFIITGDHSTPAKLKGHSWHNVPILLWTSLYKSAGIEKFNEKECLKGSLGIIPATSVMPLALANSLKLSKFGA